MTQIINPIGVYKSSTSQRMLFSILAVVFILLGLVGICFGMVFFALAMIGGGGYFFYLKRKISPNIDFQLFGNGIKVLEKNGKKEVLFLFEDIEDTVCFLFGKGFGALHFAFRKTINDSWYLISPSTNKYGELVEKFRQLYLIHRLPVLKQQLTNGQQIIFRMASSKGAFSADLFGASANAMLSKYTEIMTLNQEKVCVSGKEFDIRKMQSVAATGNNEIVIFDNNNSQLLSMPYTYVTNPDIFIGLLNLLIENNK